MVEFFTQFAIAQIVLCLLILLAHPSKNPSIRLFILLMLSSLGYLISALFVEDGQHAFIWWFGFVGGNAIAGVFWLVSLSVFGDHVILKRWQYALASLTLIIPLTSHIVQQLTGSNINNVPVLALFVSNGALLLELVLITHALVIAVQNWRDDLVQERRYLRGGVISISGAYIILKIVFDQLLQVEWHGIDILLSVLLVVLVTGINFFLFQLKEASLFEVIKSEREEKIKAPSKELSMIISAMTEEKLYQKEGLTITSLAKHLAIQEYKLRMLINGELNFRNFNDYLNYYRIAEVSEKLVDTAHTNTPILTLALESGFRSLSSFNKAFKATHGLTPTEYRKKSSS